MLHCLFNLHGNGGRLDGGRGGGQQGRWWL